MKSKIFFALNIVILKFSCVFAQDITSTTQKVDYLLSEAYNKGMFSGLVAISQNNQRIYSKEIGFADWETKRPVEKSTLFNIGSLNKKFTEEIIRQLVAEKKLSYEDNLNKYLNMYPVEIGNKITIQQLIDMKSGLGDFIQNPTYLEISSTRFTLSDLVKIIQKEPLLFEPGTSKAYSNSGYVVLGAVIEQITEKSYETNLKERIADPLGLHHIFYSSVEIQNQTNRAVGTEISFDGDKKNNYNLSNATSAGGLYTNLDDLEKFAQHIFSKTPLISENNRGVHLFAGGSPAWNSIISFNEKNGYTVIVMANMGEDIAVKIAKRLHSILSNEPFPPLDLPFKMELYKTINEKGYDYVKINVKNMAAQQRLNYDDRFCSRISNWK